MSHNAYQTHQRSDETIRETEAHALLSCASRLEAARAPNSPRDVFFDALRHNQQLWTLFQACLCDSENALPRDLKVLLLNLNRYVDKVTFRALEEGNREILRSLININRTLASGLSKKPPATATTQPATTATTYTPDATNTQSLITSA